MLGSQAPAYTRTSAALLLANSLPRWLASRLALALFGRRTPPTSHCPALLRASNRVCHPTHLPTPAGNINSNGTGQFAGQPRFKVGGALCSPVHLRFVGGMHWLAACCLPLKLAFQAAKPPTSPPHRPAPQWLIPAGRPSCPTAAACLIAAPWLHPTVPSLLQARTTVVEFLKEKGLFRGTLDNPMRLGLCSRWVPSSTNTWADALAF